MIFACKQPWEKVKKWGMKPLYLLPALALAFSATANELAPAVPYGPVEYTDVTYAPTTYEDPYAAPTAMQAPAAAPSSQQRGYVNLNLYTTKYQVRGMGVTDGLSNYGYSTVSGSYTFANRNLFYMGIQHRISGEYGIIWDASSKLGDTPLANVSYALGKEVFPNLLIEAGYTFRHGGLEGYMAKHHDGTSHRGTQEFNLTASYNDNQRGFFGHATWGLSFYGLTGNYFDVEGGYRFTDALMFHNIGADVELSAGIAPSLGYWGSDVDGVDAYRVKVGVLPYSLNGRFGRDARFYVKPWAQVSWSGNSCRKIDRHTGYGPIDHFQVIFGLDMGYKF